MERERSGDPMVDMKDRYSLATTPARFRSPSRSRGASNEAGRDHLRRELSREILIKMYSCTHWPARQSPVVVVAREPAEVAVRSITARGSSCRHIDGVSSLEMILDVSGMAPLDCLRILYEARAAARDFVSLIGRRAIRLLTN